MSFNILKDNSGRIIKKTLNDNNSIGLNNNESLASSYSSFTTNVNTLTLNNQLVNSTASELNKTIVTPGISSSDKVLVLDSNKDISNINSLSCQDIIINGTSLNSITSNQSNVYLNNINRIEALMLLYFLAIFIQSLVERSIRHAMKKKKLEELPLYPEDRSSFAPTTNLLMQNFIKVCAYRVEDENGKIIKTFNIF